MLLFSMSLMYYWFFMFDRLGRREDESPFILKWFVEQGVEVWSVKEGQQTFEKHEDDLINYVKLLYGFTNHIHACFNVFMVWGNMD